MDFPAQRWLAAAGDRRCAIPPPTAGQDHVDALTMLRKITALQELAQDEIRRLRPTWLRTRSAESAGADCGTREGTAMTNRNGSRKRFSSWAVVAGIAFVAWTAAARADTLPDHFAGRRSPDHCYADSVCRQSRRHESSTKPFRWAIASSTTSPSGPPVPSSERCVQPTRSRCCGRSTRPCAR